MRSLGFNGAALSEARKQEAIAIDRGSTYVLQWGRAFGSAETGDRILAEWIRDLRFNGAALSEARKPALC